VSPSGAALTFSTFLGSPSPDIGESLALDGCGVPIVVGTAGNAFPVTPGAYDDVFNGGLDDAFVAKVQP
jgi:hypothetical protein